MPTIFITGIDTDVGKTVATGLLAAYIARSGHTVITQKMVQTGCTDLSEDIQLHRHLMGIKPTEEDANRLTCPYLFALPASPHLAAQQEQTTIIPEHISQATRALERRYEYILLEGVGGMYVPLNEDTTILDYLEQQRYPVILVSSAKLGSINHTLLSLDVAHQRNLDVLGIIYNRFPSENPLIAEDSECLFRTYLKWFGYNDVLVPIPRIDFTQEIPLIDFSAFIRQDAPIPG